jgi:hypothetical protein
MIFWGGGIVCFNNFKALYSTTSHFPFCLFPSIADDIHIVGPSLIVSFAYEHFQTKLLVIGLFI